MDDRYAIHDPDSLPSPSLLFYLPIIQANLRRALTLVEDPARLRPHVKTHKTPELVRMVQAAGVTKHKCATLREAEMLAEEGAPDILIAYQMVGPNQERLATLMARFPETTFRCVADDVSVVEALSSVMSRHELTVDVLVDLDVGMHRTGIAPGDEAAAVYRRIADLPGLEPGGLHAYDGHNRASVVSERDGVGTECLETVRALRNRLVGEGLPVARIVMGGTPPFPFYARQEDVEASPGTFILHDCGYGGTLPDLGFVPAAILFSRVISRPVAGFATIDLGHKAIAADPAGDRGIVLNVPGVRLGGQSEEHWVLELTDSATHGLRVGDPVFVCPTHVCPTVALHQEAIVIDGGRPVDRWQVAARNRT
ncbi:D-TA family PLP-dependent enzyme [Candidatus Poribacteria bacterium]|nr:D-TA family PLP-dependent enzyme [Candidatus Poribacteria bacterium]